MQRLRGVPTRGRLLRIHDDERGVVSAPAQLGPRDESLGDIVVRRYCAIYPIKPVDLETGVRTGDFRPISLDARTRPVDLIGVCRQLPPLELLPGGEQIAGRNQLASFFLIAEERDVESYCAIAFLECLIDRTHSLSNAASRQ